MTTTADTQWGANKPPSVTEVEQYGIAPIPPEDRTATPFDLFRIAFGGANTFATVVLGAFPTSCRALLRNRRLRRRLRPG